jgi:hypothetical protein
LINSAWQALIDMAEIGIDHRSSVASGAVEQSVSGMADAGLPTLGRALAALSSAEMDARPAAFLTASYAMILARRLMIEMPWVLPG